MCFPADCSVNDINGKFFFYLNKDYQIIFSGNYVAMMDEYNSTFSPSFETKDMLCYKSEDKTHARDPTKGLDLAIFVILGLIGLLICVGTLLELAMESKGKDRVGSELIN